MQDATIPTLSGQNLTPSLSISQTQAQLSNQGYTYNQAGFSFNQTGESFGGIFLASEDVLPSLSGAETVIPQSGSARLGSPFLQMVLSPQVLGGVVLTDKPILTLPETISMKIKGEKTQATVFDQGYTYNQAGFSYNQTGESFGGVYNTDQDNSPLSFLVTRDTPGLSVLSDKLSLIFSNTQAILFDQGYTYNQAGFSFNQVGVSYGGVYNQDQDTLPITFSFKEIYTRTGGNKGQSVGPGWLLFVTY